MLFCVKTPINKLYVFAMALLLAVTLAGCGSSGGTADTTPPDPPPMECPAGTSGTYPDCTPDPTPQEMCEADGGRWNADMTCTSAEDLEAEEMARVAAVTKAAGTKAMAIAAELAENTRADAANPLNAGLGGTNPGTTPDDTSDDTAVTTYSMTISRDNTGTKVEITDTALPADATPPNPQFMQAMDLGGGTTMHTRAMAADDDGNVVEEVVIVSTDIEAPKATAFAMVAGQALNARDLDDAVDADGDGTATNDFTALAVGATADVLALVKGFAANTVRTLPADDAGTTNEDEAGEVRGTYNTADGTYRCNGAAVCTVTTDAMGVVTGTTGELVFIPDLGATSDIPDGDYLYYGFWLKKTTDADDAVTYNEVETFAASSVAASGDVTTVLGQATYNGGATGVYVKNVYNPDRTLNMATSGHFTADVSLTATFGQLNDDVGVGTIAPNLLNTVSGTIGNFMLSGGEENMWSVAVAGTITPAAGTAAGTAKGGDGDGSFSATFHGSVAAVDGVVPQPGSVVGEFNAGFSDGSVAGAFGARKMME